MSAIDDKIKSIIQMLITSFIKIFWTVVLIVDSKSEVAFISLSSADQMTCNLSDCDFSYSEASFDDGKLSNLWIRRRAHINYYYLSVA